MYTIKQRSKAVHKQLMIIPNDGREQVIFNVDLIPEQVAGKFGELCWKIQQETEKKQINAAALGEAIVGLLTIIFGIEQTKTIMEIYKNNYTDLLLDITPFLIEEIKPAIIEASKNKREELQRLIDESKPKKKFWK